MTQLDVFILGGAFVLVLLLSAVVGLAAAKLFDLFTRKAPPDRIT